MDHRKQIGGLQQDSLTGIVCFDHVLGGLEEFGGALRAVFGAKGPLEAATVAPRGH